MSIWSGRCDLANHIMMEKHRTKEGSDKKEDLDLARVLYSDEMECFNIFKERTGGVIHQHLEIEVTPDNQNLVAKKCDMFKIIPYTEEYVNKKGETKTRVKYKYQYWDREYKTLKELNKHGVFIDVEIHFNTLLDIIPYYPYLISFCSVNKDSELVYIASENSVISERNRCYQVGIDAKQWEHYNKELQRHYQEVVLSYYNPAGRECEEKVKFNRETRQGKVSHSIDIDQEIEWETNGKIYWTHPVVIDAKKGIIEISKEDLDSFGNEMIVKYVKQGEKKLFLG